MSSNQGRKKGKGRGRHRQGRGRGGQARESESTPGGLQQRSGEERGATALPVAEPEPQLPEPTQTSPQQAQAVGQTPQVSTPSQHKQGKGKQQKKSQPRAESASLKPVADQSSPQPSEEQAGAKRKTVPSTPPTQSTSGLPPSVQAGQQPQATASPPQTQQPTPSRPPPLASRAELKPPRRPDGGGKSGRPIKLRANFLPVKLPQEDIHHYDTEIKAKGQKRGEGYTTKEAPRIIQEIVKQYERANPTGPKLVYDKNGKNIYCRCLIPGIGKDKRDFNVLFTTDSGKEREYTVQVQWVGQVSLYNLNQALEGRLTEIPRDTLQAVEVVLRHLPSMSSIPVGPSFFSYPDGHEKDLGNGLQIWNGTFVSIRPTQWKMMLNVDTCSTAFYKAQPVLHFMCDYLEIRNIPPRLDNHQWIKFNKEMKTIKVETTHIKRRQKVSGLSRKSAREEFFDCEGTKTSVFDYFRMKYNITLRYPDLPCIKLGAKGNCIPMELCNILQGQRKQGRLTGRQTQEMIKYTALPAPQRQQKIVELIRKAKYDQDQYCRDFGIRVGQEMVQVPGRVLDPPMISYGPQRQPSNQMPRDGVWRMDRKLMYDPAELREWALVSCENQRFIDDRGMDVLVDKVVRAGQETGLRVHPHPCHRVAGFRSEGIGKLFGQLHRDYPNLQLIIVVLPGSRDGKIGDACYAEVKHYGDVVYGIKTQCIKANNARRAIERPQEMEAMVNIFLKINAKLGGTTCVLDKGTRSPILRRPVIIFGADVTHPSPQDVTTPSIAAVVASMDAHPNLYSAEVRVQKHRQEMIEDLKGMVKTLLQKFRNKTGAKPEKILFYRDGVSEGQFKDVLIHELQAIQRACVELHPNFKPGITFIVVQKRHHARFFAENPRDQKGKSKNIPAGTVVDQHICHPFEFDWYLCSHAGIQGTSKPAHYHVLYDDNDLKSDDLQILTNQLCHTYVRCARAVSIPAPAYYAHHVAFRARHHLSVVDRDSTDGSVASGPEGVSLSMEEIINAVTIHENMNSTMYFA